MRLGFICNEYPPLHAGGIGVFVKTLAEALAGLGVEVWVLGYGGKRPRPFLQNGVRVFWIHLPNILYKKMVLGGFPYSIASLIKRHYLSLWLGHLSRFHKFDVIESYDFSGPLASKPSSNFIVRLHGSVFVYRYGEGRPKQISPVDRHYEVNQVRVADHLVAVSNHIGETTNFVMNLRRSYDVIYNGVDTQKFYPQSVSNNEKQILFVGNLMWRKGVFDLIHALPMILEHHEDATLTIAGGSSGDHAHHLEVELEVLNPSVRKRIRLLGKVPHDQLPALYNQASVFAFPSRVEAFGLTCIEAMACGRPVVATSLASGPELVEDGVSGLLADPRQPQDLAEKIHQVFNDPALAQRLGTNARHRVLEKFDLRDLGPRNLDFYQSIV